MKQIRTLYIACVFLCLLSPECYSREAMATTTSGIKDSGVFLLASWYSVQSLKEEGTYSYSKGIMANGRQFSDNGLTAACNSYPLGTKVKVTRTDTKASVVVLVTDRTAKRFTGKRIDLSAGAFAKLAPLSKGLIKVIVEVL